jgi:hypothetical protein
MVPIVNESPITETLVDEARTEDVRIEDVRSDESSEQALARAEPSNSSAATEPKAAKSPALSTCLRDDSRGDEGDCMRANSASAARDDPQNSVNFRLGKFQF